MSGIGERLGQALEDVVKDAVGDLGPNTVLLTCEVGRPVSLGTSGELPVVLRERASDFVDMLPQPGRTSFVPELDAFSTRYQALLEAATRRPGLAEDVGAATDRALAAARQRFDAAASSRLGVAQSYWVTEQEPAEWFRADGSHWQTMHLSEGDPTPPPPPKAPWPYQRYQQRWRWRTPPTRVEAVAELRKLGIEASSALQPVPPGPRPVLRPPSKNGRSSAAAVMAPAADVQVGDGVAEDAALRARLSAPDAQRAIVEATDAVAASSAGTSIDLSYTVVSLQRDWLDTTWWSNPYWHIPGTAERAWSAGDVEVPGQLLSAVPVAFVVVKDVRIAASWSGADAQLLASAAPPALGPFALAGATLESGTLTIAGQQVIAVLCKVPPVLPPVAPDDSSRVQLDVSLPTLQRGEQGPAVRLLQGLLMAHGSVDVDPSLLNGIFGPKTDAAVRAVQQDGSRNGDEAGTVGTETWRRLLTP